MEKRRLGRGLDALLGITVPDDSTTTQTLDQATVPLDKIGQNPFQPRKDFDEQEISALSESIKTLGMLQPIVVRPDGEGFQLVAGERRMRAAQAAGQTEVPVRIVNYNDQNAFEATLVENIQREDLNPIEKAHGFKEYLDRFEMKQEELAERLALDRTTVNNLVGLLELPIEVQDAIRLSQITMGHAKALKGLNDPAKQVALCKEIIARGHSVHTVEGLVREAKSQPKTSAPRTEPEKTSHVQKIENELRQRLATKVEIRLKARDKGQITIAFESNDDFERILEALRIDYN